MRVGISRHLINVGGALETVVIVVEASFRNYSSTRRCNHGICDLMRQHTWNKHKSCVYGMYIISPAMLHIEDALQIVEGTYLFTFG